MVLQKGVIALMGSGELTSTMVEVHKELLARLASPPQAVFLDTPAGFQLNVDQLSQKAVDYFRLRVQRPMTVASFKSQEEGDPSEAAQAFQTLRDANYILIGPGSPTYAVRNWRHTPVPEILCRCIDKGGCLVAASAAALTVGRFALPVYEIYKVGAPLHWVEGVNVLGHFGFNLAVIPHWNNGEGGTHDTRHCYMGVERFQKLQSLLPGDVAVFGLDEHTACLLDLESGEAVVKGIGQATLRCQGAEITFKKGDRFPLDLLCRGQAQREWHVIPAHPAPADLPAAIQGESFWDRVHALEASFQASLEQHEPRAATRALRELDVTLWQAHQDRESPEFICQGREILREMIVFLGAQLESMPKDQTSYLDPLVRELLALRERFREEKKWQEADAIRDSLQRVSICIEDTRDGTRWRLES
jgi:hypothetical protein